MSRRRCLARPVQLPLDAGEAVVVSGTEGRKDGLLGVFRESRPVSAFRTLVSLTVTSPHC